MKKRYWILIIVIILIAYFPISKNIKHNQLYSSDITKPETAINGTYFISTNFEGLERDYIVHVPKNYNSSNSTPVVFNFHGGGGTGKFTMDSTKMNDVSEKYGFIAVYPSAYKDSKKWNVGPITQDQVDLNDQGFIKLILDNLEANFNIDEKRIYATGHSRGGFFSFKLACDMSDTFAALAPAGCAMVFGECNPSRPIPIMHFHGTADKMIPFNGGPSDTSVPELIRRTANFTSVNQTIQIWLEKNECPDQNGTLTFQNGTAYCITYSNCSQNTEVVLCSHDGGHTWPSGEDESSLEFYKEIVGKVSFDINANEEIWKFFEKHPMP